MIARIPEESKILIKYIKNEEIKYVTHKISENGICLLEKDIRKTYQPKNSPYKNFRGTMK